MSGSTRHKIVFLTAFFCVAAMISFAQQKTEYKPEQFRAHLWTTQDGLSFASGHVMIKDAKGFLWIGSVNGELCRFDGAKFRIYIPEPDKRGKINSGSILGFVEDSLNNIWIGTDKGLSRYDMSADTFANFKATIGSDHSKGVIPFWATSSHVYCFESEAGFIRYDVRTSVGELVLPAPNKTNLARPEYIILDSASNCLWTLEGYSLNPDRGRLLRISLDNGEKEPYEWPCPRENITHRHSAEAMQFDRKRNSIWINTGDGLLEFTLADKKFHKVDAFDEYIKWKDYERWVGIDIDRDGKIWLATHKGILIYDPKINRVQPAFSDPGLQKKTADANLHLYCDREGIVWSSSWGIGYGLYELLPFDPSVKRYAAKPGTLDSLSNGMVWNIVPADKGKVWLGTNDGINIFDPFNEKFEVLREKDLPGIRGKVIVPVHIDTVRQKAWLYANVLITAKIYKTDVYEMDVKTRKCRRIIFRDGTKQLDGLHFDHTLVRPYKNGILVAVDHYGLFEVKEGDVFAELVARLEKNRLISGMVLEEERLVFLKLWNRRPNLHFENKNGKWTRKPHIVDSLDWRVMVYNEKDQTHWVGFKYKLIHYNKDFREIKTYTGDDGYTGLVYKMAIDNTGNLWFVNDLQKVGRLNISTGIITMLSETDGYHRKTFDWSVPLAKDTRGNLYFGTGYNIGDQGLDCVYPEKFASARTSSVYLGSLAINQKLFSLPTGINSLEELSLRYNQNTLSIETGIIDFHAMGKGSIRYKLQRDGRDENWQYGPAYYTIRYDGLTPGKYKLVMQAANAGNEFNSPEKIITIIISPPFWQTWWFRVLAILFVLALIYGFIQYRSRNLKQKNILLEKKVNERTSELNNSLSELKTTQNQLIHSEKMASLGELTSGIAHEIKNPLNFINNFSELNLDLLTDMNEEQLSKLDEHTRAELVHIIKTLKKNSEKINHHGKRVDDIVKSMLQHSRVGNLAKEPVNINALCEESLKLAYHGFKAKEKTFQASFETHFDPGLPSVMAIPQELSRVLLNLFNNAFYAVHEKKKKMHPVSPDGSEIESSYKPFVTVSTGKLDKKIVIKVSDNGTGIPPKIITKIFQPFFTTKPTGEGTGLGLSMSYDIITKSHGGELRVKSIEGEGTDFEIILPV